MEKPDVISSFKMKKLLGIVILCLLLSGNAYAEIIKFAKCAYEHDQLDEDQ